MSIAPHAREMAARIENLPSEVVSSFVLPDAQRRADRVRQCTTEILVGMTGVIGWLERRRPADTAELVRRRLMLVTDEAEACARHDIPEYAGGNIGHAKRDTPSPGAKRTATLVATAKAVADSLRRWADEIEKDEQLGSCSRWPSPAGNVGFEVRGCFQIVVKGEVAIYVNGRKLEYDEQSQPELRACTREVGLHDGDVVVLRIKSTRVHRCLRMLFISSDGRMVLPLRVEHLRRLDDSPIADIDAAAITASHTGAVASKPDRQREQAWARLNPPLDESEWLWGPDKNKMHHLAFVVDRSKFKVVPEYVVDPQERAEPSEATKSMLSGEPIFSPSPQRQTHDRDNTMPTPSPTRVFISYSHDSPGHSQRILDLANQLRAHGVDVELDQYHVRPPTGWPRWCEEQLRPESSEFVVVVCTETYLSRIEGRVPADEGRGVFWEGSVIYNYLYDQNGNHRFIPVLLEGGRQEHIPAPLRGATHYRLGAFDLADPGYLALYRELTRQPAVVKPSLGHVVPLSPDSRAAVQVLPPVAPRATLTPSRVLSSESDDRGAGGERTLSCLDRFPATPAGHLQFIERVRDEVHGAADAKRNQSAQAYPNDMLKGMVDGIKWNEARARLAMLIVLPSTVVEPVGRVLRRELTVGTVERLDQLLQPCVQALRDAWEHMMAHTEPEQLKPRGEFTRDESRTKEKPSAKVKTMPTSKILFLAANPDGTAQLALDEECREIEQKIRASAGRDALQFVTKWALRPDDLLQYLNEHRPHVVHFSGHGSKCEEIILLDETRAPKPVSNAALKYLFGTLKDNIRVVVLNACYSRPQAEAITEVIDCAIGMNKAIGDKAAISFAASFYRAIGFGRSVKEAFDQGKARLMLEGIPEENTPVLLVRKGVDAATVILGEGDLP